MRVRIADHDQDREELEFSKVLDYVEFSGVASSNDVVVVRDSSPVLLRHRSTFTFEQSSVAQGGTTMRVRDLSRLWAYRNGMTPALMEGEDE